jgi:hypothetical protein
MESAAGQVDWVDRRGLLQPLGNIPLVEAEATTLTNRCNGQSPHERIASVNITPAILGGFTVMSVDFDVDDFWLSKKLV